MVKSFSLFLTGCCVLILLSSVRSTNSTERTHAKRQTDSFVVSANYGVQSVSTPTHNFQPFFNNVNGFSPNNTTKSKEETGFLKNFEILPTPSAWRASSMDHFSHPSYVTNQQLDATPTTYSPNNGMSDSSHHGLSNYRTDPQANNENIVYGTVNIPTPKTVWYSTPQQINKKIDAFQGNGYEVNELTDTNQPSVEDLQQIISKIIKGSTKVHQVVKVPAVYEIHLQEQVKTTEDSKTAQWSNQKSNDGWHHNKFPLKWTSPSATWNPKKNIKQKFRSPPSWYKPSYRRGARQNTKTWNLPSKISYFKSKPTESAEPIHGKYSYPRGFSKWESSAWTTAPSIYYNVPITPGTTAVTFLSHPGAPDLSLYYAKKKEIESRPHIYRRNDIIGAARQLRQSGGRRMFSPLTGMNYIIHVREKPGK